MESFHFYRRLTAYQVLKEYASRTFRSFFAWFFPLNYAPARSKERRGFTLIELLVVMAIITIITGVMFTNQSSFNRTLILSNSAYDIALTLRASETYGISSRVLGGSSGNGSIANVGYGLHFASVPTSVFTLFADRYPPPSSSNCHRLPRGGTDTSAPDARPGNCSYDPNPDPNQDEKVLDYALGNGIRVSDFCAYESITGWTCTYAHDGAGGGLSALDVVFARPDPNPFVNGTEGGRACITLSSSDGTAHRYVSVTASGSISANATQCPLP